MTQQENPVAYPAAPVAPAGAPTWQQTITTAPPLVERLPDRIAARAVVATLAAAFLAQLLFVRQTPGLNFVVWVAVVLGAAYSLRRRDARLDVYDIWIPTLAMVFAAFIAIRADASLLLFDVMASTALTLAGVVAIGGHSISRATWARIVELGSATIAVAWIGIAPISRGFAPLLSAVSVGQRGGPVIRGLAIALPLVLVFVILFAAADAVFQAYMQQVVAVRLDGPQLVSRIVFALMAGWLFAGAMAAAWISRERFPARYASDTVPSRQARGRLGTTEALIVLVALIAVFAFFVAIQAAYLFPSADPLAVTGLTYAEYARRGFFELVVIALLVGAVIVGLDALIERRSTAYLAATVALALLTGAVLVSAIVRLSLYQQAYGWTELRFYVVAAIVWLGLGLAATVAALLLRRVAVLPKFMLGSALAVAVVCNAIGPQSFVTGQNLERAVNPTLVPADGYSGLDLDYIGLLGADAVPGLLAARDELPTHYRIQVDSMLLTTAQQLRDQASESGWPSWNMARQQALELLTAAGF